MWNQLRAGAILRASWLLAFYLAGVAWLTWPLAGSLSSVLPCPTGMFMHDIYYSTWALAHESHALLTAPWRIADANIFHPTPSALFYGPAGLGALPLFAPVFLATGNPTLAINVTFLVGLALTGAAMHVVVRRWTGSDLAGVVGAATLLANQWVIWAFVPTAPHWAALELLPLIAFVAAAPFPSMRAALRLLPLLVLQCLTDLVYVAPAVLGPLGVLAAIRILRRDTRAAAVRLVAVLALTLPALLPVYRGYLGVRAANPNLSTQTWWVVTENTFPAPLPDRFLGGNYPLVLTPVAMALVGLGALVALGRRRAGAAAPVPGGWAHGALWAVVGAVLSLPALVTVAGALYRTPLGYLAMWSDPYRTIRVSSRLGVAGLLGLGILSGVAFGEIASLIATRLRRPAAARVGRGALAAVVLGLVYHAYATNYASFHQPGPMPVAYPLCAAPTVPAPLLPPLRASHEPLLEVPLAPGAAFVVNDHAAAMYHSIAHWRPLLNGYSSYWPADFPQRMADAASLPDPVALDRLVETTGLAMVWLHAARLPPAARAAWLAPPRDGAHRLQLVVRSGTELLYAVVPATPSPG